MRRQNIYFITDYKYIQQN